MKMQCLYYALDKVEECGGYLVFRRSTHWCMPHVLHLDKDTFVLTHYVPPADLKYPWYSMFGFEGYIKTGDTDPAVPLHPVCMLFGALALLVFGAIWFVSRRVTRKNKRSVGDRRSHRHASGSSRRRR